MSEQQESKEENEFEEESVEKINPKKEKAILKEIGSMILYVLIIFGLTFLIVHYVGQRTRVSGSSMESTLSDGDNLIVDKISYRFHEPERFDIVIFPYEYEKDTYYIKRIIGMPGETIWIDQDGQIYINDEVLEEFYGLQTIMDPGMASTPITLADDEYFVMGDNRNNSTDSRFEVVGPIKRDEIIGKAWLRIYPFNEIGFVRHQYEVVD